MSATGGEHLVLYDGLCGLCHGSVQFILARDPRVFHFAPLQSATGRSWLSRFGKDPDDLDTFVVITGHRGETPSMLTKADAALFVVRALGLPWRALGILRVLPRRILNACYDVVARRRYRVFGRYATCPIPSPEQRARFVDI